MRADLVWYNSLYRFVNAVYFARITVMHRERLPRRGPVLFVGLHRNGAVDGFVYHRALGGPVFLISTQLRRNWLARLFFQGIAVTRTKDCEEAGREGNEAALRRCLEHLRAGGRLFVFPEGTSSLGPRHLPFKSGAAWLMEDYQAGGGPPLQVVPVGIHYECPWAFRSKVEVVIGSPLAAEPDAGVGRLERLKQTKRRLQAGLEQVGINVISAEYQEAIQRLAYVSTLATDWCYFDSLKALEHSIPEVILAESAGLENELRGRRLLRHQNVPLFPMGRVLLCVVALLAVAPVVLAAILLNLPPYLAGWLAGRKLPDDRNVISLWKILVGVPAFALWAGLVAGATVLSGHFLLLAAYALLTWLGVALYYRVKKLAVAVHNGLRYPALRGRMLAFRQTVLRALSSEKASTGSGLSGANHGPSQPARSCSCT